MIPGTYRYTSERVLLKAYKKVIKSALYNHSIGCHYLAADDEKFARELADEMERVACARAKREHEFHMTGGY
jgi:hypothetical protein